MIKLELNSQKELSISKQTKVFKGENRINSIQVTVLNPYIGDKRVEDCEFNLHIVLPDKSYIVYPVAWSENSIPLTGFVPITSDITSAAQFLQLYIEITAGNTVIGKTNTVKLQVYDSPEEQTGLTPREQLEEQIEELTTELQSADTLTQTLNQLKGAYNSFPERLSADELNIAANSENIHANQSAIVSLTAALGNKLNNSPASVSSSNIADNAVTSAKIADNAVTGAKLADTYLKYVDDETIEPLTLSQLNDLDISHGEMHYVYAQGSIFGSISTMFGYLFQGASMQIFFSLRDGGVYTRLHDDLGWTAFTEKYAEASDVSSLSSRVTTLENTVGTLNTQLENALNGGV